MTSHSAALDTLRLIRSQNVGPITFFTLVQRYGSPTKALERLPELAARGGAKKPITVCDKAAAERELSRIDALGAKLIPYDSPEYPAALLHIPDPPPVLTAHGHTHLWNSKPCIGMVGARNASANGCHFAKKLARELGEAGVIVVSGLARGIDSYAHQGALATGTIGVIGGGIDNVYPPENAPLFQQLREQGCILSEQPYGAAPHSRSFPARNRIISGMSRGVLVVEASIKSGSLITGRCALEHNRDVFAVPGSPLDPRSHGCNALIKEGAILTESVEDILSTLRTTHMQDSQQMHLFDATPASEPDENEMQKARRIIDEMLGVSPVSIDLLIDQSQIPAHLLLTILVEKELAGVIQRHSGNKVSLIYR
ncbi:MAG: DNA-processing protein DprA [Rickettsiales bacterium]|nr:DNA-processing protein DprA [Rickettsiales bacterium]